jgi:transcription-repair coupling factor (superfamily II helicase)
MAEGLGRGRGRLVRAPRSAVAYLTGRFAWEVGGPLMVVVSEGEGELARDLQALLTGYRVYELPGWGTVAFDGTSPAKRVVASRLAAVHALRKGTREAVVVASLRGALQVLSPFALTYEPIVVRVGDEGSPQELSERLARFGYVRDAEADEEGFFAIKGAIVDAVEARSGEGVRVEFSEDSVVSIRAFRPAEQVAHAHLNEVVIYPATEFPPPQELPEGQPAPGGEPSGIPWDRAGVTAGAQEEGWEVLLLAARKARTSVLREFGGRVPLVVVDPSSTESEVRGFLKEESELIEALAPEGCDHEALSLYDDGSLASEIPFSLGIDTLSAAEADEIVECEPPSARGRVSQERVDELCARGIRVFFFVGAGPARRLEERVPEAEEGSWFEADGAPGAYLVRRPLARGCVIPSLRVAIVGEVDLWGRQPSVASRGHGRWRELVDGLAPGTKVVHRAHGVGIYRGLVTEDASGAVRDYLVLEYRGGDQLWVPVEQVDAIRPYTGGDPDRLDRLGGSEWGKRARAARMEAARVAMELVELYRQKESLPGFSFRTDAPLLREVEESFPFEATPGQQRAIEEVLRDMASGKPMDRLVCGDVGFGKTEVIVRAVAVCVWSGKQAAVLVPTTLLALQHFERLKERLAPLGVEVAMVSRLTPPDEVQDCLRRVAEGRVDVVVGTHRIAAEDVEFRDLGLLVVDEEHRFGVNHKEAIRKRWPLVDVLSLSANPIPRTLQMALSGIKDISVIDTPPPDRRPVVTHVGPYSWAVVERAIRRELARGGQVFYVRNRIAGLPELAERIQSCLAGARVAWVHGEMSEARLEEVMRRFAAGELNVLVATTIVESGLDLPSANTMVVEGVEHLGLGQLHQLRGRVGRGSLQGYVYLLHDPGEVMTRAARERLRTVAEESALGAGFRIAMKDLQIRGAGTLLGLAQSGHAADVGYDLYLDLVKEAVAALSNGRQAPRSVPKVVVKEAAYVPEDYVPSLKARFEIYERLHYAEGPAEVTALAAEVRDRYGPLPEPVRALVAIAGIRELAAACSFQRVAIIHRRDLAGLARPLQVLQAEPAFSDAARLDAALALGFRQTGRRLVAELATQAPLLEALALLGHLSCAEEAAKALREAVSGY